MSLSWALTADQEEALFIFLRANGVLPSIVDICTLYF